MAEDDVAQERLSIAIERVNALSWPEIRHKALTRALDRIADLLHLDIVRIEPAVKIKPTAKMEDPNDK